MNETDIVIVGGGAAGLTTAGALKQLGIESVILDKDANVGDVWARRYDRLRLHTIRSFSGLAHYSIPRNYPRYLSRDQFVQYLRDYAQHFNLNIVHNCLVNKISTEDRSWVIDASPGQWHAQIVIVATGHYGQPFTPSWPGLSDFQGKIIHSIEYKTGKDYTDQRVLVIGSGNSGSEIAVDLVEQGAVFVANSIRTPPPVVPRDFLGTPVQLFGILLRPLPPRLADKLGSSVARVATGDLSRFGVRPAAWHPFTAHKVPIIDVGWMSAVKAGRIRVRVDVARFTRSGVVYNDGQSEDFDTVISATGFKSGLDQLIAAPGLIDDHGEPKFRSGTATNQPGFYFMGYAESTRGLLFETNRDSRRLAKLIKSELHHSPNGLLS
jgi:cation diffusion facilitator CzcD-associated flavoprotein CzcO